MNSIFLGIITSSCGGGGGRRPGEAVVEERGEGGGRDFAAAEEETKIDFQIKQIRRINLRPRPRAPLPRPRRMHNFKRGPVIPGAFSPKAAADEVD